MLIQFKSNEDEGSQHIADFVSATEADMQAKKPCNLILDQRFNDGGNYMNTYGFGKEAAGTHRAHRSHLHADGPSTFSAGISTTAFHQAGGGARVTILGEPVGDQLQFFSEGNRGCLPHYPLCVAYETGKHDYQHPCRDWDICFWPNYYFTVRVNNLDPDETIALSFADWRAGHDPVFERALQLAKSKRQWLDEIP